MGEKKTKRIEAWAAACGGVATGMYRKRKYAVEEVRTAPFALGVVHLVELPPDSVVVSREEAWVLKAALRYIDAQGSPGLPAASAALLDAVAALRKPRGWK